MLILELPPLPKALRPNHRSRSHWPRTNAIKTARGWTYLAALHALQRQPPPRWTAATVQATFYIRNRRSLQDPDNLLACLKPVLDGLQDANVLADDDQVTLLPPVQIVDGKPRVEIRVAATLLERAMEGRG